MTSFLCTNLLRILRQSLNPKRPKKEYTYNVRFYPMNYLVTNWISNIKESILSSVPP